MKPIATNAPAVLIKMFFERENIQIPTIPMSDVRTESSLNEKPIANRPAVTIADSAAPLNMEPITIVLLEIAFFA